MLYIECSLTLCGFTDGVQLFHQGFFTEWHSDIWDICFCNVIFSFIVIYPHFFNLWNKKGEWSIPAYLFLSRKKIQYIANLYISQTRMLCICCMKLKLMIRKKHVLPRNLQGLTVSMTNMRKSNFISKNVLIHLIKNEEKTSIGSIISMMLVESNSSVLW